MNTLLNKNIFYIKRQKKIFGCINHYDIFDPQNNIYIIGCFENKLNFFNKIFRFTCYKKIMPFTIEMKDLLDERILVAKKGTSFFKSRIYIFDKNDNVIGIFIQKMFSMRGTFKMLNIDGNLIFELKGKWSSWDFKFIRKDLEIANVSRKWIGFHKELFNKKDNYILQINENVLEYDPIRLLIMASSICVTAILKD